MRPEDHLLNSKRPFTGEEYLASLNDGREVYIYGEKIKNVVEHPALENTARSVARLYDELHRPESRDRLCGPTDTGNGGYTHKFFKVAMSSNDLREQRDAIAAWAELSFGWLARSPDYKGAFNCTLGILPDFYGPFADNARRWYKRIQDSCLYLNHAIITPSQAQGEGRKFKFTVEKETEAGIYVSGAKVVATNAALNHAIFISHVSTESPGSTDDCSTSFIVSVATKGVKLILRQSYEYLSKVGGTIFDYPLSSRFDENDAILIFDNVFVPWEDVLIYKNTELCQKWFSQLFGRVFPFHSCTRMATKMNFLTGLFAEALEITGADRHREVKAKLGEVVAWRNLFWSLSDSMWASPERFEGTEAFLPNSSATYSFRIFAPMADAAVKKFVNEAVASGLVYLPSSAREFENKETAKYLGQYLGGANGASHQERVKVLKLLWDAVGTEFAGRASLFEINNAGGPEVNRIQCLNNSHRNGDMKRAKELLQRCLSEYDETTLNFVGRSESRFIDSAIHGL